MKKYLLSAVSAMAVMAFSPAFADSATANGAGNDSATNVEVTKVDVDKNYKSNNDILSHNDVLSNNQDNDTKTTTIGNITKNDNDIKNIDSFNKKFIDSFNQKTVGNITKASTDQELKQVVITTAFKGGEVGIGGSKHGSGNMNIGNRSLSHNTVTVQNLNSGVGAAQGGQIGVTAAVGSLGGAGPQ